jgi:UDP-N-acetylglucosamine transferase subunit ALG13
VASLGGHLELLEALRPALDGYRRVWVSSAGARLRTLAEQGEEVRALPRLDRGSATLAKTLAGARLAWRERPSLVLSSGAGLAVPFTLVARGRGARLLFAETMARVQTPSATGRLLTRFAERTYVQWPELQPAYPTARLCRPLLLEGVGAVGGSAGTGTFVTVGSHDEAFPRLLGAVERAAAAGVLPAPITVQAGGGAISPAHVEAVPYLSPGEFAERLRSAAVVVSHGGAGALATALRAGKKPLAMARRASWHEHVDDHQLQIVGVLASLGLAVTLEDRIEPAHLAAAREPRAVPDGWSALPSLVDEVRHDLARLLGA